MHKMNRIIDNKARLRKHIQCTYFKFCFFVSVWCRRYDHKSKTEILESLKSVVKKSVMIPKAAKKKGQTNQW